MTHRRSGAVTFAALIIVIAGTLDLVWGISALAEKEYFDEDSLLFEGLKTWGWIYIVIGVIQAGVGLMIFAGKPFGYALGMFGAFLAIIVHFVAVGAYPVWSVMLIALNFFILWALATHLDD